MAVSRTLWSRIIPAASVMTLATIACATSGTGKPDLAAITRACAVRDSLGQVDTSPIYTPGAVTKPASERWELTMPRVDSPGGVVAVRFVIDTLGRADLCTAAVTQASDPSLGDAMLRAASTWRFYPATLNGHKVREVTTMVVRSLRAP